MDFEEEIQTAKYSIEISINGSHKVLMAGNDKTIMLAHFEDFVSEYYNEDEEDDIIISFIDIEDGITIKSYNSKYDK